MEEFAGSCDHLLSYLSVSVVLRIVVLGGESVMMERKESVEPYGRVQEAPLCCTKMDHAAMKSRDALLFVTTAAAANNPFHHNITVTSNQFKSVNIVVLSMPDTSILNQFT